MKKIILTLLLILLFASANAQQKYTFGNITLKDTSSGDMFLKSGALYVKDSIIINSNTFKFNVSPVVSDIYFKSALAIFLTLTNNNLTSAKDFYAPNIYSTGVLNVTGVLNANDNLTVDSIFATKSYTITLDADDKEADTKTSYLRIDSDDALSTERTFTLSDGTYDGQELFISFIAATNQAEIIDAGSEAGLNGNFTFDTQYESLTMKWDATLSIWMEQCRVDN